METELEVAEALQQGDLVFIDVRSPAEFAQASIPGAVNIPLFDDEQYRRLGLLYYEKGEAAARRTALELAAPRLPALVDQIAAAAGSKTPLLYCWRGGLRSLSLCQILNLAGVPARRLKGGYRAYRRYVYRRLKDYRLESKMLVLHGLTGVGKTLVIRELIRRRRPAIDLEGLAGHRGSVFGSVGLPPQRSQKDFEGLLLQELDRYSGVPRLVVEGEGGRIGNVHLPRFLTEAMERGEHVLLTAPLETRVKRILEEYLPPSLSKDDLLRIRRAICSLKKHLGETLTAQLLDSLDRGDYAEVVTALCRRYYDRLYGDARPEKHRFLTEIESDSIEAAADRLEALLDSLNRNHATARKEC